MPDIVFLVSAAADGKYLNATIWNSCDCNICGNIALDIRAYCTLFKNLFNDNHLMKLKDFIGIDPKR